MVIMTRSERSPIEESNVACESNDKEAKFLQLERKTTDDGVDASTMLDLTPCEGSDSGVEMNTNNVKSCSCRCRSNTLEGDSESDVTGCQVDAPISNTRLYVCATASSVAMTMSVTDDGDECSRLGKLSISDREPINGEALFAASYDAASENGSESSSVDDTRKCRVIGGSIPKPRRQPTPSSRPPKAPAFPADSINLASCKESPSYPVCRRNIWSTDSSVAEPVKSKLAVAETRSRGLRSFSGSRARITTSPETEESMKWSLDTVRIRGAGRSRLSPCITTGSDEKRSTFDTYATLPRRKPKDVSDRDAAKNGSHRDPSLNRAASLRKKFLENTLMTTSMNASIGSSTKTLPPYLKPKSSKTKIYHETASQTLLTNADVDEALSSHPFDVYNDAKIQAEAEYIIKKRYEEQLIAVTEELKKVKKENAKQRTVIEWLEGELASAKDEKCVLHNKCVSMEERIQSLLRHNKGHGEDILHQLEREVFSYNNVIAKQQEEINELQSMCCSVKQELDKSYSVQKSILDVQKANDAESLELQEFLQAEKITLTDSLKDIEQELASCRTRLTLTEQTLTNKQKEYEGLESTCEKLSREKQALSVCLSTLERRCRELLVHQGAAISGASVALSGLGSRFDQLLERLVMAYNITDSELSQDEYASTEKCDHNGEEESKRSITGSANHSGLSTSSFAPWLAAIRDVISRTSASIEKPDTGEGKNVSDSATDEYLTVPTLDQTDVSISDVSAGSETTIYLDSDSRRNSILLDMYVTDDNLMLDFNVNEPLSGISNSMVTCKTFSFLKDCPGQDISLVEQAMDVDKQATKMFKALVVAFSRTPFSDLNEKTEVSSCNNSNGIACVQTPESSPLSGYDNNYKRKQNGISVPGHGNAIAFLRLQHKTVANLLSVLHHMQDAVDGSNILKKIQSDLQDVSEKCNSFFSSIPFDTAV